MNKVLKIVVALLALVFASIGLRWLVAPEGVAVEFGMILMEGLGLSSQIGDLGAFTMAWMFHGASLAVDMIAVEIIACVVLYLGSARLADED